MPDLWAQLGFISEDSDLFSKLGFKPIAGTKKTGLPSAGRAPTITPTEVDRPSILADVLGRGFAGGALRGALQMVDPISRMSGGTAQIDELIRKQNEARTPSTAERQPLDLAGKADRMVPLADFIEQLSGADEARQAAARRAVGETQPEPVETTPSSTTTAKQQRQLLHDVAVQDVVPPPVTGTAQALNVLTSTVPFLAASVLPGGMPLAGVAMHIEDALSRADRSGVPLTPREQATVLTSAVPLGLSEALPFERLLDLWKGARVASKTLGVRELAEQLYPRWRDYLGSAAVQAAAEGGQETFSGLGQDVLQASYGGLDAGDVGQQWKTDLAGGGGVGAFLDVVMKLAGSRMGRARLRAGGIDPQALRNWYRETQATAPAESTGAGPATRDQAARPEAPSDAYPWMNEGTPAPEAVSDDTAD